MLGHLLRSDGFPRWLVASALDALVADASVSLAELSGGQFELTHENGEFLVVDHTDADARRPVKTLSGGETFQASLALALALSAQMSGLAAHGAARLESIFLDEGFGTLDEANLETVAGTLEALAARGDRMVGVITHVPALAERVPVRFAVRRDQRSSCDHSGGCMRFTVDPWDPAYGSSVDAELGASTAELDPDVEVPGEQWAPIPPQPGLAAARHRDVRRRRAPGRRTGVGRRAADGTVVAGLVRLLRGGRRVLLPRGRRAPRAVPRRAAQPRHRGAATPRRSSPGRAPTTSSRAGARAGRRAPAQVLSAALQVDLAGAEAAVAAAAREATAAAPTTCSCSTAAARAASTAAAGDRVRQEPPQQLPDPAAARRGRRRSSPRGERTPVFRSGGPSRATAGTCGCPAGRTRRGRGSRGSSAAAS